MTRNLPLPILMPAVLLPRAASAHVGHLGEVAGHGHWVAGAAIGAAALAGLWVAWKDRKGPESTSDPKGDAPEPEAVPA